MSEQLHARERQGRRRKIELYPGHDFCSNDYLGLASHGEMLDSLLDGGSTGSRLISGNSVLIEQFERTTALFHGLESSLLFSSGYAANTGLLSCIAQTDDLLILDSLSHASLIDGARLSRAPHTFFEHNDLVHLTQVLESFERDKTSLEQRSFVVVESLYSMDGDFAPLFELAELCKRYHASLIVDEAHAIGVYGEQGAGLVALSGLQSEVFAVVFTYGKAMGRHGAVVAGSDILRDYLINYCRPFIYSTAPSPQSVQGLIDAYKTMRLADQQRRDLLNNINYFAKQVKSMQFDDMRWLESSSPIQALVTGDAQLTKALANQFHASGFALKAIVSPTVPKGTDRIRVCLHSHNTLEQIDAFAQVLQTSCRGFAKSAGLMK